MTNLEALMNIELELLPWSDGDLSLHLACRALAHNEKYKWHHTDLPSEDGYYFVTGKWHEKDREYWVAEYKDNEWLTADTYPYVDAWKCIEPYRED